MHLGPYGLKNINFLPGLLIVNNTDDLIAFHRGGNRQPHAGIA